MIDSVKELKFPWDTTSFLASASQALGAIYFCHPKDLFWDKNNVWAHALNAKINPKKGMTLNKKKQTLSLNQFQIVWMRKDPPIDANYIQTCQLLALAPPSTLVLNNPQTLMLKNEKLFALEFQKWIPQTIVSRDKNELHSFLQKQSKVVIKPLDNRGSIGVRLISKKEFASKSKWLDVTNNESAYIMAQEYLPEAITQGDKRIVLIDGKPIGAFLRPATPETLKGRGLSYVSDLPTELTLKEKQLCRDLAPQLKKLGLFFVGIDVIAEKLIEINITSPAGIPELNHLYGKSFEKEIFDLLYRKFLRGKK